MHFIVSEIYILVDQHLVYNCKFNLYSLTDADIIIIVKQIY